MNQVQRIAATSTQAKITITKRISVDIMREAVARARNVVL